jgi:WD40 repeat protein
MKIPGGRHIGPYEILEIIEDTSCGTLFRAKNNEKGETFLVKEYFPTLIWTSEQLQKFFQLVDQFKFIEHDNLLPILDFGKENGKPYLVFPNLNAELLKNIFTKKNDERKISNIILQISQSLLILNKSDIVHGFLNPENIFITTDGTVKVSEFGISNVFQSVLKDNMLDSFLILSTGNPRYTAPEQILSKSTNQHTDMYLLGLLYYEGLNLQAPLETNYAPLIAESYLSQQIPWPKKLLMRVSHNTRKFIQKCLQNNPESRFKNLEDLIDTLEKINNKKLYYLSVPSKIMIGVPGYQSKRAWLYPISFIFIILAAYLTQAIKYDFFFRNSVTPIETQLVQDGFIIQSPKVVKTSNNERLQQTAIPTNFTSEIDDNIKSTPSPTPNKPVLEGTAIYKNLSPISSNNINNLIEVARLGIGKVEEVDLSNNYQFIAIASSSGVYIYNENTLIKWIDPGRWATSVQISADNQLLAIGLDNGEIQIWDWKNEELKTVLSGHTKKITRLLFSSNSRNLYSASFDQHVIAWNLISNKLVSNIIAHSSGVRDIAVSPDGRILATCSSDQVLRIWDLASSKKLKEIPFPGRLDAIAISQDGEFVAAGGDQGLIRQWSLKTYQIRTDPIPVRNRIWSLEYILDDKNLFVGIDGGAARFYKADQLEYKGVSLEFNIPPIPNDLLDIFGPEFEFSSSSASYGDLTNYVKSDWSGTIENKDFLINNSIFDNINRINFSDDSQYLAAGGNNATTNIWMLSNNSIITKSNLLMPFGDAISPANKIVLIDKEILPITRTRLEPKVVNYYQLYDLKNFEKSVKFSEIIQNSKVSFTKDGTTLISGALNQSKSWDEFTGYEIYQSAHTLNNCWITKSSNDGTILQINSNAGIIYDWDEKTDNICLQSSNKSLNNFAFSNNQNFIVTITNNGLIQYINSSNNQVVWNYHPDSNPSFLAISNDGSLVVLAYESGLLQFLDGISGSELFNVQGSYNRILALAFSPNNQFLATAGLDGTVRLFGIVP